MKLLLYVLSFSFYKKYVYIIKFYDICKSRFGIFDDENKILFEFQVQDWYLEQFNDDIMIVAADII